MRNLWLKKNPYMSLWLSGANAAAGSVSGHTAMTNATRDIFALWVDALAGAPVRKRKGG
jgi:hypothetical protein